MGVINDLREMLYQLPLGFRRFLVQFPIILLIGEMWFKFVSNYLGMGPDMTVFSGILPIRYIYGLLFLLGLFFIRDKGRGGI